MFKLNAISLIIAALGLGTATHQRAEHLQSILQPKVMIEHLGGQAESGEKPTHLPG